MQQLQWFWLLHCFSVSTLTLILNSLTTVGYLLGVFFRLEYLFGLYFDFCLEIALETWAKASLTKSLWVHDPNHTHSLASFQWSGLSDQRALHLTECCLQVQKWCPYNLWMCSNHKLLLNIDILGLKIASDTISEHVICNKISWSIPQDSPMCCMHTHVTLATKTAFYSPAFMFK